MDSLYNKTYSTANTISTKDTAFLNSTYLNFLTDNKCLTKQLTKRIMDYRKVRNPMHPSLCTKRVQGTQNILEASVNMNIRMTWQYVESGILLRNIGEHDETLKNL
jgi:hypothetical protein